MKKAALLLLAGTFAMGCAQSSDDIDVSHSYDHDGQVLTVTLNTTMDSVQYTLDYETERGIDSISVDAARLADEAALREDGEALQHFLAGVDPAFLWSIRTVITERPVSPEDAERALQHGELALFYFDYVHVDENGPAPAAAWPWDYIAYGVCYAACEAAWQTTDGAPSREGTIYCGDSCREEHL